MVVVQAIHVYIVACQRGGVSIKARQTSTGNDKTRCRNPLVLIKVDYSYFSGHISGYS